MSCLAEAGSDGFESGLGAWDTACDPDGLLTIDGSWSASGANSLLVEQDNDNTDNGAVMQCVTGWGGPGLYTISFTVRVNVADWNVYDGTNAFAVLPSIWYEWGGGPACADQVGVGPSIAPFDATTGAIYGLSNASFPLGTGEEIHDVEFSIVFEDGNPQQTTTLTVDGNPVGDDTFFGGTVTPQGIIIGVAASLGIGEPNLPFQVDNVSWSFSPSPVGIDCDSQLVIPRWRFLLADVDGSPMVVMDRIARDKIVTYQLNASATIQCSVSSDTKVLNETAYDGAPVLTEGDRLLYAFRRDYDGDPSNNDPWTCRAAGLIMNLEDGAFSEQADTTIIAYDPWQYLYALPVVDGNAVEQDGLTDVTYPATPIDEIIVDLLALAEATYDGPVDGNLAFVFPHRIDYGQVFAGAFYTGTIEALPPLTITFAKESTIGEAFDQLCATGMVDIVLAPIYDPSNRPGITHELNVYDLAGTTQADTIFGWDKPGRSVSEINRLIDGTERGNKIRFHSNIGEQDVPTVATEGASVGRFGEYWKTQFFPAETAQEPLDAVADELLNQISQNKRTVTIDTMPGRAPNPFMDFNLGDEVRIYASKNIRSPMSGFQRISAFSVEIDDNSTERVGSVAVYIPNEDPPES